MSVVDVHAHYVSRDLIEEARRNGTRYGVAVERDAEGRDRLVFTGTGTRIRPFFPDLCDLSLRRPGLARASVDVQVVSTWTDIAGDGLPAEEGARWARLQNETLAAGAAASGGAFAAMGTLPLQSVPHALAELDHLVRNLGLRSVEIGTHIAGRELDDEAFRPVWKRLAELDVLVFLHPPLAPIGADRVGAYFLNNLISYPADTTVAAARLLFGGVMHDYPGLKVCLAHGGGFLPYQIGRMDRGFAVHPACQGVLDRPPSELLGAFHYDTITHDTRTLAFLLAMVGPDRLLYGSDQPFEMLDPLGPARLRDVPGLGEADRAAIGGGNARRLFGLPDPAAGSAPVASRSA